MEFIGKSRAQHIKEIIQKHPKAEWAVDQVVRWDRNNMVEDICKCGVGHPNSFWLDKYIDVCRDSGIHGCCGCCDNKIELKVEKSFEDLSEQMKKEQINNPDHYKGNKLEVIEIIEDFELGFNLGNVIKYVLRANKKENYIQDLKKASWYLQRVIDSIKE